MFFILFYLQLHRYCNQLLCYNIVINHNPNRRHNSGSDDIVTHIYIFNFIYYYNVIIINYSITQLQL